MSKRNLPNGEQKSALQMEKEGKEKIEEERETFPTKDSDHK